MAKEEQIQDDAVADVAPAEQPEKNYTQKQLDAILTRREGKWKATQQSLESKLEELSAKFNETQEKANASLPLEEKLKKITEDHKKAIAKLENEKQAIVEKARNSKVQAELMKAASKSTRPEIVAMMLKDKIRVDDDDRVFALDENDIPISVEEAAATLLQKYPEFVPAPQGGTGMKKQNSPTMDLLATKKGKMSSQEYNSYVASLLRGK